MYAEAYRRLKESLKDKLLVVEFDNTIGFAACFESSYDKVIFINKKLIMEHKLYVLCHEIGHFYRVKEGFLSPLTNIAVESKANHTAINLLDSMGIDHDYMLFYESVVNP